MAIDVYWGSGSPYSWRVLLALAFKRLEYTSHLLQFSKQEHQSPQILALKDQLLFAGLGIHRMGTI